MVCGCHSLSQCHELRTLPLSCPSGEYQLGALHQYVEGALKSGNERLAGRPLTRGGPIAAPAAASDRYLGVLSPRRRGSSAARGSRLCSGPSRFREISNARHDPAYSIGLVASLDDPQGAGTELAPIPVEHSVPVRPYAVEYQRHKPEGTLLHEVVRENLEPFLARARSRDQPTPRFVEQELGALLRCGVLAHGFLRLHCDDCGHDRLVAFSCKRRGFCPSCGGRRMADTAAHLVDRVLPQVSIRQWVLTLPYPLRYLCAYNAKLTSEVLRAFLRALFAELRRRVRRSWGVRADQCGAVTFIQRFGSALNLNLHFHTLALDGAYTYSVGQAEAPRFLVLPPPSNNDVSGRSAPRTDRLELDDVAVRIFDVCERHAWGMLAAPNQLSACRLKLRDGGVEIGGVREAEPEVGHASIHAGQLCLAGVLVEGEEILATRGVEEDHLGAITEAFHHPEYAVVESKRLLEISDNKMDVCETLGLDQASTPSVQSSRRLTDWALSCVAQAADGR